MVRVLSATIIACLALLPGSGLARADTTQANATQLPPSLFNTTEIRSPNLASFTNWTGMLTRFHRGEALGPGMCASAGIGGSRCEWDQWQKIIADLRGKPADEQLRRVNNEMNSHRYILDRVNWGVEDYWQTVFEFLRKNGDCEDYAISKYLTLRALGWDADKLRIVILRDTKLNLNHAVLAAYTEDGIYIGDNQITGLVKADNIRHYRAIYSINENGWWLHRPQNR